jgi:opacity protein-like surface antigen
MNRYTGGSHANAKFQEASSKGEHRGGNGWQARCWLSLMGMVVAAGSAQAQTGGEANYVRTSPYLPYSNPEPAKYNLKVGRLTARLYGTVNIEYNDNINLSETAPKADFSIGPTLGIGFIYALSKQHTLQFDVGAGYRWYLNNPSVSSFNIIPSSRLDYTLFFDEVRVNVHDFFQVQTDPISRVDISGNTGVFSFQRFVNTAGVQADWRPLRKWGFVVGYDYSMDRSLSRDFASLDHSTHTFSGAMEYLLSPRWTLGLSSSYSIHEYDQRIQNNGSGYTLGPTVTWKVSKNLVFNASVGYSVSQFNNDGTIGDLTEFGGIIYQFGAKHTLNRHMNHDLRLGFGTSLGFGSNFNETFTLQYTHRTQLSPAVHWNNTLVYENFLTSGLLGEKADRYTLYSGTSFQLTRNWSMGLGYSFSMKDSDQAGRSYTQNRILVDMARQF